MRYRLIRWSGLLAVLPLAFGVVACEPDESADPGTDAPEDGDTDDGAY